MTQGRKKNVARPGLEPRVSRLPCEHSTTELPPFGGLVWVRARAASSNLKETVSSVPAWFRADLGTNLIKQGGKPPHTGHQMSKGWKKNVARPGLEPRVSRLPCEHSTTELPSHSINQLHLCGANHPNLSP